MEITSNCEVTTQIDPETGNQTFTTQRPTITIVVKEDDPEYDQVKLLISQWLKDKQ